MSQNAVLHLPGDQTIELPVLSGSENEKALDISKLRSTTGYITMEFSATAASPLNSWLARRRLSRSPISLFTANCPTRMNWIRSQAI
jgi:hypothetical protein